MNEKQAKNLVESLIFSPMNHYLKKIKKILCNYGNFNFDEIIKELTDDYKNKGVNLVSIDKNFYCFRTSEENGCILNLQRLKK